MSLIDVERVPQIALDAMGIVWAENVSPIIASLFDEFQRIGASSHYGVEQPEFADQRIPGTITVRRHVWQNFVSDWAQVTPEQFGELLFSQFNNPGEPVFSVWTDRVTGFERNSEPFAGAQDWYRTFLGALEANSLRQTKSRKKGLFLSRDGEEVRDYRRWPPRRPISKV